MSNRESPFTIFMTQHKDDSRTFEYSLLMDEEPINPDYYIVFWSFGDGSTSVSVSGNHTFANSGDFMVACQVEPIIIPKPEGDEAGASSAPPPPPIIIHVN